jgi:hypothetical protein
MNPSPAARFVPTLTEVIDPADCLSVETGQHLPAAPFDEAALRHALAEAVNLAVEEMRLALLLKIDDLIAKARPQPLPRD